AQPVVAAGGRDDAAPALLRRKRRQDRERVADLEGAGRREVLVLDVNGDAVPDGSVEGRVAAQRRLRDPGANAPLRRQSVGERDGPRGGGRHFGYRTRGAGRGANRARQTDETHSTRNAPSRFLPGPGRLLADRRFRAPARAAAR